MSLVRINRNPSSRQLWLFASTGGVLALAAALAAWRRGHTPAATILVALAVTLPLLALLSPKLTKRLYVGLSAATWPVGWVVSHLVLMVIYYGMITPIGLVMRLGGRDPLARRLDRRAGSFWRVRPPAPPATSYFRQ